MNSQTKKYFFSGMVTLIAVLALPAFTQAQDKAIEIVRSVLDKLSPGQWKAEYDFVNHKTDGSQNAYSLEIMSFDPNTAFISFTQPRREAGRQVLNKEGELWSYLPDSRKIVRLTDRDSIGNGDFNNADVLRLNWLRDYTPAIAKDSEKQTVIDLTAKTNTATYYKIRLWVAKAGNQPIQQFFYDESGHHMKSLKYQDVKSFGGLERPALLIMENVQTGQRTQLTVRTFSKEQGLPANRFRQENLGK